MLRRSPEKSQSTLHSCIPQDSGYAKLVEESLNGSDVSKAFNTLFPLLMETNRADIYCTDDERNRRKELVLAADLGVIGSLVGRLHLLMRLGVVERFKMRPEEEIRMRAAKGLVVASLRARGCKIKLDHYDSILCGTRV